MNITPITKNMLPVIAGVQITVDQEGRYNLNALHKASGLGANKAPAQWLRTQGARELSEEIEKETVQICIVSAEGRNGGTFAHELLAISYAGWISPAFQLQVNQTFLDYRSGKLQKTVVELSKLEALQMAIESEEARLELEHKVVELEPKAEFHDRVVVSEDAISVAQAAKSIGTGRNRLMAFMREIGWVSKRNEPYQSIIEQGLMNVKISKFEHPEQGLKESITPIITGKGLAKLQKLYRQRTAA